MCEYCKSFNEETKLMNQKNKIHKHIETEPYRENILFYQLELESINKKLNSNDRNRNKIGEIQEVA